MPVTLSDAIRRVRSLIDEPATPTAPSGTARFYSDTEITDWINDGLRDISRRAEDLITYDTSIYIPAYGENPSAPIPTYPLNLGGYENTDSYIPNSDVIRINRVEFQVGGDSSQVYPLEASNQNYMDQIWNIDQLSTMSYPAYWVTRGYPGGTGRNQFAIQVYPNPGQPGQLNIFYYRMPFRIGDPVANSTNYNVTLDIIEGWDDLVVTYAQMQALIKTRDQSYQAVQQMYESKLSNMIDATRRFNDQPTYMSYDNMVMPWAFDSWGGF